MNTKIIFYALFCGITLGSGPTLANPSPEGATNGTPMARLGPAYLAKVKAIESNSHSSRIAILQAAETCIQNANTREAYVACEKTEKESREVLRNTLKPQREALRNEIKNARQDRKPKQTVNMQP